MTVFYGTCPFLSCTSTDVHAHSACRNCGAGNHGNIDCRTCVETWDVLPDIKDELLAVIAGQAAA